MKSIFVWLFNAMFLTFQYLFTTFGLFGGFIALAILVAIGWTLGKLIGKSFPRFTLVLGLGLVSFPLFLWFYFSASISHEIGSFVAVLGLGVCTAVPGVVLFVKGLRELRKLRGDTDGA